MKNKRIIIGGGGTGGHVFPAISIAKAIMELEPEAEMLFVGAENKLEMEKVPEAGFQIVGLPVAGFQRKQLWKNTSFLFKLYRSMRKSAKIIESFRPAIAVGVGGYASGPILRAAANRKIPVVIQEQNSYAGVTNRILAKRSARIFVAYDGMEKYFPPEKIVFTGNPIRQGITGSQAKKEDGLKYFGFTGSKRVILIIGGSLGAGSINRSIENGLDRLGKDFQIIWQTGKIYHDAIISRVDPGGNPNLVILPFIKHMDMAYGAADIIISRAGAGTISELAVAGKPVILVPSPNVAEDHQTKNAMALVRKNAAIHIPDNQTSLKLVDACMAVLEDEKMRRQLSENIRALAIPDAADRIAREILELI